MSQSQLFDPEMAQLVFIADELRESFSAEGLKVDLALDKHRAFGAHGGRSRSSLRRDLAVDTIVRAAAVCGVGVIAENGAIDLVTPMHPLRRYRVRSAARVVDGRPEVTWNSESVLGRQDDSMLPTDWWVFTWLLDDDGTTVKAVVAARVEECIPGKPGRLVLGPIHRLGGPTGMPPVFDAPDEDLDLGGSADDTEMPGDGSAGGAS